MAQIVALSSDILERVQASVALLCGWENASVLNCMSLELS
jgi:hypothetical protein